MIRTLILSLLLAAVAAMPAAAGTVAFDFAQVGNAGNAPDPTTGYGAVAYNYAISKTEVTNAQYAEFLNAVAATDNFGGSDPTLYNTSMGFNALGGITRSGDGQLHVRHEGQHGRQAGELRVVLRRDAVHQLAAQRPRQR